MPYEGWYPVQISNATGTTYVNPNITAQWVTTTTIVTSSTPTVWNDSTYYAGWNTPLFTYTPYTINPIPSSPAKIVNKKARALLYLFLDEKQKRTYRQKKFFDVLSQKGRRYRVKHGTVQNVLLLDDKRKPVKQYCAHPTNVPVEDTLLAQKLMLENDEAKFLKTANASEVAGWAVAA